MVIAARPRPDPRYRAADVCDRVIESWRDKPWYCCASWGEGGDAGSHKL